MVGELLANADLREQMGSSARSVIMINGGATQRTLALLGSHIEGQFSSAH